MKEKKTADAASKMFDPEKTICVSWCGGGFAVSQTDWSPLYRREVVIWPDNDEAGCRAEEKICSQLRRVGMKSLKMVDDELLRRDFLPKWDLAGNIPSGYRGRDLRA